ncbi:unnamed protein product [Cyprideis torosa]|uniref:Uncharacterized protein n=1 Tax=Cyprideis torosa TaxID=163714 RepID=A0A7R8WVD6_9CRUS|nr:unnamed protein product [Cyprideis torosa]CAG0907485.1 unnamed protein product [Cyprideis torosa]
MRRGDPLSFTSAIPCVLQNFRLGNLPGWGHYPYHTLVDSESVIQRLSILSHLKVHSGCVNTICWDERGELILSGSDDQHLKVTNAFQGTVEESIRTSHHANIFNARFFPGGYKIASCDAQGLILVRDLLAERLEYPFRCSVGCVYEVHPVSPSCLYSCGEDGHFRRFDVREAQPCMTRNCSCQVSGHLTTDLREVII